MRRDNDILRTLIYVFAGLIAVAAIALIVYYNVASKKLKGIEMTPDFIETQLEVGTRYTFTVKANPKKASLKKIKCIVDDPTCSFDYEDGKAVLTTGISEGAVTVYVECSDIKSQVLTFSVIDSVAKAQAEAAAAAAEAEMQEQEDAESEEAEAASDVKLYVKCIGDDVRVRAENNTDCDILGKAKNGQAFEKVEEVDDWTHIIFDGRDAYMKSEYLAEISETQYFEALQAMENDSEEEKKEEEKKQEENNTDEANNEQANTQTKEEAEAKAKADAEAQAAAELQAQLEAQAALAAASTYSIECADGAHNFRKDQYDYIKAHWSYTGEWEAMAHKHTYDELILVCQIEGGIY